MLLTLLFWLVVALNLAVLGLWLLLALAAAPSAHTSPLPVVGIALLPFLLLAALAFLFHRSTTPLWRIVATLLAAAPALWFTVTLLTNNAQIAAVSDASGQLTFFPAGPARDLATAITKNDAATVAARLPQVDVNNPGFEGMTLLTLAMRQLRTTPQHHEILRLLLKAGANPNLAPGNLDGLPLTTALQLRVKTGPEPVQLLLAAGANPNATGAFGTPAFFSAIGPPNQSPDLLPLLLERGADLKAKDQQGHTALHQAATIPNWNAVLLLLQRGAGANEFRSPQGQTLPALVAQRQATSPADPGLAELAKFLLQ
jgi:ankyrin repeat protein